jgi:putative ABC transport system ATP-binding protein
MKVIEMREVSKVYKNGDIEVHALRGVTLGIDTGSFVSFIGPSGSGKTTLLNLLGCLARPTAGGITIAGQQIQSLCREATVRFRSEHLGFIFQDFNLIPVLTVFENVEYPLIMVSNVRKKERAARVMDFLSRVGMSDQKDKLPSQISGGQKQRVAVARALVTNPKVVLADEPTANLDHQTALKVIAVMKAMKESLGTTFIFSTHDQKIVGEAEWIYVLEDGRLVDRRQGGNGNAQSR